MPIRDELLAVVHKMGRSPDCGDGPGRAMLNGMDALQNDRLFFDLLRKADRIGLDQLLREDFLLIDVFTGSEIGKAGLLDVLRSGQLVFDAVEVKAQRARVVSEAAVVTGETRMRGSMGGSPWSVHSRYTHVHVREGSRWRMVSAQGTEVKDGGSPAR